MVRKVNMVKVEPKLDEGKIQLSVVSVEADEKDSNAFLQFAYKHIGCDCIDVTAFGYIHNENHFAVTVDDEGLLKSDNVVMELTMPIKLHKNVTLQLCGTLLIGHVGYIDGREDEGMYELGLTDEQIQYVYDNLKVKVIGITN